MSQTYKIIDGIIHTKAVGNVALEDFLSFTKRWMSDPLIPSPYLVCRDASEEDFSDLGMPKKRAEAVFAAELDIPPNSKLAIVAPENLVFGMARMYSARIGQANFETQVFRSQEGALQWLKPS